jgi:hypothetical protein
VEELWGGGLCRGTDARMCVFGMWYRLDATPGLQKWYPFFPDNTGGGAGQRMRLKAVLHKCRGFGKIRAPHKVCHGYPKSPREKTNTVTATTPSVLAGCKMESPNPFAKYTNRMSEMLPALQWAFFTNMTVLCGPRRHVCTAIVRNG